MLRNTEEYSRLVINNAQHASGNANTCTKAMLARKSYLYCCEIP